MDEPMDPIRYRGHTPPSDREFYPFDNFHVRGEEFGWNSDQAFVTADGSSVAEPARFLLKAAPLNAFEYQATLLTDQPSLFLDSLLQPEPIEGSLVSPTLQYVTRENFENSRTLHPGFQPKQPNESLGRSASSMSGGQQSLYQAIMSLEYTSDGSSPHSSTTHESSPSSSTSTQPQPSTNVTVELLDRDVDPEGIEITICGVLPLDPGVESNSLPFVLQSYAKWMRMMVFDPSRTVHKIKDHIIRRYIGSTQSRFRMILTANLLRAVIVFDTTYNPMLSILTNEIRQTLVQSKDPSLPVFWDSDISPLDYTLELNIFSLFRPLPEALQVLSDIAPVIRRMCSDPTAQYVHLPSLLAHGDSNVRGYPAIDIMYSMLTGLPTQLKYDANSRLLIDPGTAEPVGTWLIGQPRELTLILARIFSLHDEFGVDVDSRIIEEIESDLKDFRPDPGISVEPSLMVTRLVVLEAWRQVGYINLYMRLCGESALGPRVRVAHRRLMDLFATTKSGLTVNLHLAPCLGIAGLAATQTDERNLVLARLQSLPHSRADTFLNSGIRMFQYIWVQTDSEGRPARWSDLRAATWRIVGI